MRKLSVVLILALFGCKTVEERRPPTFSRPSMIVERLPLPEHPDDAPLAGYPGGEDELEPISKGEASPMDGIVVSERRAARDGEYRSRYSELRLRFELDRSVWSEQRNLYEQQLDAADQEIRDRQPNWFEQHAFQIGVGAGVVVGVGVTVLIAYAIGGAGK